MDYNIFRITVIVSEHFMNPGCECISIIGVDVVRGVSIIVRYYYVGAGSIKPLARLPFSYECM